MGIKIALIRHGDAPFHPIDSHRQLSSKGREEASQTAQYLKDIGFRPEALIHSGLDRARDTAEIIRQKVAAHLVCDVSTDLRPSSLPIIWENNLMIWEKDTIFVSHMPFLPELLEALCDKPVAFPTAGCVILEKQSPQAHEWKILQANF